MLVNRGFLRAWVGLGGEGAGCAETAREGDEFRISADALPTWALETFSAIRNRLPQFCHTG